MDSIMVFASGGGAMGLALWLIYRYRSTERAPTLDLSTDQSRSERFALVVQRGSAIAAASVVAGVLVLGLGGRLLMRMLAVTSPDSVQGRLTDAEEVVGEITMDGTLDLVLFIGLLSAVLSFETFVLLRRYLPRRSAMAGVTVAALGGGLFARPSGLIDPDNHDFVILSPRWLAVLSCVLLILVFGLLLAILADRWAQSWPEVRRTLRGALSAAPLLVMFLVGSLAVVPGVLVVAAVLFAVFVRPRVGRRVMSRTDAIGNPLTRFGAAAGGAWVLVSATQVMLL